MRAVEWWLPPEKRTPPPKKRKPYKLSGEPYQKGIKEYLASFKVGESRTTRELKYGSLRTTAYRLSSFFGCKFRFRKNNDTLTITRIR
jgi:hypothetical protein